MRRLRYSLFFTLFLLINYLIAEPVMIHVDVKRDQPMTLQQLGIVADLSTARDEQGKSVTLEEGDYLLASFKRTTISVAQVNDKGEPSKKIITLDLKPR